MMVRKSLADSISGPAVMRTRAAFGVVGLTCAAIVFDNTRTPAAMMPSLISSLFISDLIPMYLDQKLPGHGEQTAACPVFGYGMGLLGTGATPQISDPQGGSAGVGMRLPLPCLEGEQ